MGGITNPYLGAIRASEQIAEWKRQGLSDDKISTLAHQDGLIGSTLAPVDVPGIINLVDNGASREDVLKFAGIVAFGKAVGGAKGALPGNQTVAQFEKNISTFPPGERVAHIKSAAASVTKKNGMTKDSKLSKMNGRDVYKAKDGSLYALDTQHGRFEVINHKNGRHMGEVDFDFVQTKRPDTSGGHDLKVK